MTVCLSDEEVTQNCKVLDTNAFSIVIGTDLERRNAQVKLLSLQRAYAVSFSLSLWSCQDERNPVYAMRTGLMDLKTINWCDPSSKMDWPPRRYT